jgi:hypothetical protein
MLSNFEILRKSKLVALVVMFLVIGVVVWLLDMIHGYSLFETFTSEPTIICGEYGDDSPECKKALNEMIN